MMRTYVLIRWYIYCMLIFLPLCSSHAGGGDHPTDRKTPLLQHAATVRQEIENLITILETSPSSPSDEEAIKKLTLTIEKFFLNHNDVVVPEITTTTFALALAFKIVVKVCIALGYAHLARDAFSELPSKEQVLNQAQAGKIHKSLQIPRSILSISSYPCNCVINTMFPHLGATIAHKVIGVIIVHTMSYLMALIFLHKHQTSLQPLLEPDHIIKSMLKSIVLTIVFDRLQPLFEKLKAFLFKQQTKTPPPFLNPIAFISFLQDVVAF